MCQHCQINAPMVSATWGPAQQQTANLCRMCAQSFWKQYGSTLQVSFAPYQDAKERTPMKPLG